MWSLFLTVVASALGVLFKPLAARLLPSPEQKANQLLIDERNKVLDDVRKAKDIRDKLANSPDDGLPDKYRRD